MRLLKSVHKQQPYKILLLSTIDFLNYQVVGKRLATSTFLSLRSLRYSITKNFHSLCDTSCRIPTQSKLVFLYQEQIVGQDLTHKPNVSRFILSLHSASKTKLSEAKQKDIKYMLRYMPALDVEFYATILDSDNNLGDLNFYFTCSQACII